MNFKNIENRHILKYPVATNFKKKIQSANMTIQIH